MLRRRALLHSQSIRQAVASGPSTKPSLTKGSIQSGRPDSISSMLFRTASAKLKSGSMFSSNTRGRTFFIRAAIGSKARVTDPGSKYGSSQ